MDKDDDILNRIKEIVINLDAEGVQKACEEALAAGIPPYKVMMEGLAKGMEAVGEKYETQEYFLVELIMAGEVMKDGVKILSPHLKSSDAKVIGKVIIGTVKGDLHDIGKNIVITLLEAAGFEVYDLGVDVPAQNFIDKIRETDPDIVAMSALLSAPMTEMGKVMKKLERTGLRKGLKVIIGGAPVSQDYAKKIGADAASKDGVVGVNVCKEWMAHKRGRPG